MSYKQVLIEGLHSIHVNKTRSYLSVLGIVFGVGAVVAMLSVVEGARNDVLKRLARLGTNVLFVLHEPSRESTDGNLITRSLQLQDSKRLLAAMESIQLIAPTYVMKAESGTQTKVAGVTPEYISVRQLSLQSGRFISSLDVANQSRVCVVGFDVIDSNKSIGVGNTIELQGVAYKVVGVLASEQSVNDRSLGSLLRNHNSFALIPITSLQQSLAVVHSSIPITEIAIQLLRSQDVLHAKETVHNILEKGHAIPPASSIVIPRQLLRQEQHAQQVFAVVVGCVALIGVLVGGIGVMNIMLANVSQRCKEIGIRRAIGATQKQIALLFLTESVLLTFFGGLVGMALGVLGSMAIAYFGGWPVTVTLWSLLTALGMAGIVGVLAGYYPAIRAARLDPVDALRHD
jgi:putative ABC transport system permease protein